MCFCFMIWDSKLSGLLFMSLGNLIILVVFVPIIPINVQLIFANSNTPKMNLLESIQLVNRHTFNFCKFKHTYNEALGVH